MVLNVEVEVKVLITQSSARSRNSESFSSKGVSPLTEEMMLGIWEHNCSSVVISFIVGLIIGVREFDLLCVLMFIEGR